MTDILRLRKYLSGSQAQPAWPQGVALRPLETADPEALHAILAEAYANGFGSVPDFVTWWPAVTGDSEYDPALLFIAADTARHPVGLALCWSSGFIKDVAVIPAWRGRGVAQALLLTAFRAFQHRGLPHVDLKVIAANAPALRLYLGMGMTEAPL